MSTVQFRLSAPFLYPDSIVSIHETIPQSATFGNAVAATMLCAIGRQRVFPQAVKSRTSYGVFSGDSAAFTTNAASIRSFWIEQPSAYGFRRVPVVA